MTPYRTDIPRNHYSEQESVAAAKAWNCNCGPGSLAMMLCLKPDDVRHAIPQFEMRGYTNSSMMKAALSALGVPWRNGRDNGLCYYGLCRIQWGGPWVLDHKGRVGKWGARFSHWIGCMATDAEKSRGSYTIFDVNGGWRALNDWETNIVPAIVASYPEADGKWYITNSLELTLPTFDPRLLPVTPGRCQRCGCTDADCLPCIAKTGKPCFWINDEHTLCSACAPQFA